MTGAYPPRRTKGRKSPPQPPQPPQPTAVGPLRRYNLQITFIGRQHTIIFLYRSASQYSLQSKGFYTVLRGPGAGRAEIISWSQSRSHSLLFQLRLHCSEAKITFLRNILLYCSQCGGCQDEKQIYIPTKNISYCFIVIVLYSLYVVKTFFPIFLVAIYGWRWSQNKEKMGVRAKIK